MKRTIVRGARLAVLIGLALAVMPWRGGTARPVVYALMVLFIVYPELVPGRRPWIREVRAGLSDWFRKR